MIKKDKIYVTRTGNPVTIYDDNANSCHPIHGCVHGLKDSWVQSWDISGQVDKDYECNDDLIEVKPGFKYVRWVNVYPDNLSAWYESKDCADGKASPRRIACVRVEIIGEEGDGLE